MTGIGRFGIVRFQSAACLILIYLSWTQIAQGQTYAILHTFNGSPDDGAQPNGELIEDAAGNFYGTTLQGGANGIGTVFKIDASGNETILYSFGTCATNGCAPKAGLFRDSDGNFYGTTTEGGANGLGTVFKLGVNNVFTNLYSFKGGNLDGNYPVSRLVSTNGELFGVTQFGGSTGCISTQGCGTVFATNKEGRETMLHRFTGGLDGGFPQGLLRDSVGNLYGTTSDFGGSTEAECLDGCGTLFEIVEPSGSFELLHTFVGSDGGHPVGRLIRDTNGNIHGVTESGGDPTCNCGVVFRLDNTGNETVLHRFFGNGGGGSPSVGLVDAGGVLYGTTLYGGDLTCNPPSGCGVLYQIGKTGEYSVVHLFEGSAVGDGFYSFFGGLALGADGSIYGATWYGGTNCASDPNLGCGVIFKYTP